MLQPLKVLQHETGSDEQHHREAGLGDDEGVEQAVAGLSAAPLDRPPSFSACAAFMLAKAGTMPARMPAKQ